MMTREEALTKIKELEDYVKSLTGFNDDPIFLLSIDEYEKYKNEIPKIGCWWWLRSQGKGANLVTEVSLEGSIDYVGINANVLAVAVRPVIKHKSAKERGEKIYSHGYTWIVIDENLAIAENLIGFMKFNINKTNRYELSSVRNFLLQWYEERKNT